MIAAQRALRAEPVDVAPDGLGGHGKALRQVLDRHETVVPGQIQDAFLAFLARGHGVNLQGFIPKVLSNDP